ncbi:S41 family peptidase [Mucilaginibacter sp.]|uniref:S41 family peptidase n=1 Tax=Mucilaginibacter sp. TaxID=1882438 RepID=UPI003D123919
MTKLFLLLMPMLLCTVVNGQVKFNGNFEKIDSKGNPVGWDLTFDGHNTYEIKVDSLVKRQGKYSVSITPGNSKNGFGAINFPINKSFHGKNLILIASIKTENVTGGWAGIWLRVDDKDKKTLGFDNMQNNGITGTNDWKEYMIQVPYDETEGVTINMGALLAGKGKMWVDSLRLYLDEVPIEKVKVVQRHVYGAVKDSAFAKRSGIDTVLLKGKNTAYLTLLGQLWGLLKYYHPAVASGEHNWDAELFRVMPAVLKSKSDKQLSIVLEHWVDRLGKPSACKNCTDINKIKDLYNKPDYGTLYTNHIFSKTLVAKLRYIIANRNTGSNYYVNLDTTAANNPEFHHEEGYVKMLYPDAGYRLLALYRYWSMINYFCPNRNSIAGGWNNILSEYIPKFIAIRNKTDYAKTMVELIARINDTHAFIQNDVFEAHKGTYRLPFQARFIENKLVVTGYYKDTLNVKDQFKIGDVITEINGSTIAGLLKKYLPIVPASNYEGKLRDVTGNFLLRSQNPAFIFKLIRNDQQVQVKCRAIEMANVNFYALDFNADPSKPAYYMLNEKIGCFFPGTYKRAMLDDIEKKFSSTKGIIIDLRCYPSDDVINTLGKYLKTDSSVFAKFTAGSVAYPGMFYTTTASYGGNKTGEHYKGKIVILVNAITQSNAEFVTMALQTIPNVKVIGSTSAGADGNISQINLPGNFTTYISGLGVYYPDGTCAQHTGVKIDYVVKPTIQGLKAGRDEVLEKATDLIDRD